MVVTCHLPDELGSLRTPCHVLWSYQQPGHLPNDVEQYFQRSHQWRLHDDSHGWYPGIHLHDWTPLRGGDPSLGHAPKASALPQRQEVLIWVLHNGGSMSCSLRRLCGNGSCWDCWCQRLADPKECHQSSVLCGLSELLLQVHSQLLACSQPPYCLTQKVELWQWTEPEEKAFWELKSLIM